jgi:hypothetical protein
MWLLLQDEGELSAEEKAYRKGLCEQDIRCGVRGAAKSCSGGVALRLLTEVEEEPNKIMDNHCIPIPWCVA